MFTPHAPYSPTTINPSSFASWPSHAWPGSCSGTCPPTWGSGADRPVGCHLLWGPRTRDPFWQSGHHVRHRPLSEIWSGTLSGIIIGQDAPRIARPTSAPAVNTIRTRCYSHLTHIRCNPRSYIPCCGARVLRRPVSQQVPPTRLTLNGQRYPVYRGTLGRSTHSVRTPARVTGDVDANVGSRTLGGGIPDETLSANRNALSLRRPMSYCCSNASRVCPRPGPGEVTRDTTSPSASLFSWSVQSGDAGCDCELL
jgi:hypothetical protein